MTILQSISLSNIRRFSENVKIDFGRGATILLAPNGTGKTAIFEAIEFALTEKVSRLEKNGLNPLIRDSQNKAQVSLDFGTWTRTVSLEKTGSQILEMGNLSDIFGTSKKEDWPYLLRLTHLLDQRDQNWFVQETDPKEAGKKLAKLPIGKDAIQVNALLSSVKNNMTRQLTEVTLLRDNAQKLWNNWHTLLAKRDTAIQNQDRPLVQLSQLELRLRALSQGTDVADSMIVATSPSILQDIRVTLSTTNEQQFNLLPARIAAFSIASNIPAEFSEEKKKLVDANEQVAQARLHRDNFDNQITQKTTSLSKANEQITEAAKKNLGITEQLRKLKQLADAKSLLALKEDVFQGISQGVQILLAEIDPLRKQVADGRRIDAIHNSFNARRDDHIVLEKELQTAALNLAVWKAAFEERDSNLPVLLDQEKSFAGTQETFVLARDTAQKRADEMQVAEQDLQSVSAAVDAIRTAVSTIATHLPKERGNCPVCNADYEAEELHHRIANALAAISPAFSAATERLRLAREAHQLAQESKAAIEKSAEAARRKADEAADKNRALLRQIEIVRSIPMFRGLEFADAQRRLDNKKRELQTAQATLAADMFAGPAPISSEQSATMLTALADKEKFFQELRAALAQAIAERDNAKLAKDTIESDASELMSNEELIKLNNQAQEALAGLREGKNALEAELTNLREVLKNADAKLTTMTARAQTLINSLQNLQEKWLALALTGEPKSEVLEEGKDAAVTAQTALAHKRNELNDIEKELVRWRAAEDYQRAQAEVDLNKGGREENAYTTWLKDEFGRAENEVIRIRNKQSVMETLSAALAKEIANMGDQVKSVGPYWQALLKRLVREPRFAATNLNYKSKAGKSHASVELKLSGETTSIADIASEAQMTDIQLSFMLAMALVHSWSPWKMLLLDDPTQHHDLVNAAAVFDVLRDYIVDHGFQVVIATHDALQARFFMRKLENDGIDARLWALQPVEGGVQAKLIQQTNYSSPQNEEAQD